MPEVNQAAGLTSPAFGTLQTLQHLAASQHMDPGSLLGAFPQNLPPQMAAQIMQVRLQLRSMLTSQGAGLLWLNRAVMQVSHFFNRFLSGAGNGNCNVSLVMHCNSAQGLC